MRLGTLVSLALREARATRARSTVSVLGIALGVAVLLVIGGLGLGVRTFVLREVVRELPVHMVEVIPRTVDLGLFKIGAGSLFGQAPMDDATAQRLARLPGVEAVHPKLEVKLPLGARGGQQLFGHKLYTDLFLTGLPEELVRPEVGEAFQAGGDVVPVVISDQLIEIFNASVAPSLGVPGLTAQTLAGFEFEITVGRSLMLGSRGAKNYGTERARIVGVSRYAMPLGASVPLATARRLLTEYGAADETRYASILLEAGSPADVPQIIRGVREAGYDVDETAKRTSDLIDAATVFASLVGVLVLALAALNIAHSFFASLTERRRELAVLRSVGARRGDVIALVLVQAAGLGLAGGALGVVAAHAAAVALDVAAVQLLPDFPFKPESFFLLPLWLDAVALAAAVAAAVLGASWPAWRAARAPIVRALAD